MLTKFSVSNFKGFKDKFVFDLSQAQNYSFNKESVKDGIVNNAIVYGKNGVGKSNLGLAIFDIVEHLTDNEGGNKEYSFFLNAQSNENMARFRYEFLFDFIPVVYEYQKKEHKTVISETLYIDGQMLASIDRTESNKATVNMKGAENLRREITNESISLLKYIKSNTVLDTEDKYNIAFLELYKFVEGMLFFKSLEGKSYMGLEVGTRDIQQDIIERDNVKDFESFLNKAGIKSSLSIIERDNKSLLAFEFGNEKIPLYSIASQGTKALTLFYFWFQRLREDSNVSFLFIDEFDAFYHHELSRLIVEELKNTGIQFVLTTHNTTIMSNELLRPDCYFLMNERVIKPLSQATNKEIREAHNLEKMYKSSTFNVQ